jgi:hypothetical protein
MADAPLLRTADEVLDAVKARKESLGLSNAVLDEIAGYDPGRWSKAFGPSRDKCPTIATLMNFCDALGVSFVLVEDPVKARLVARRWTRRNETSVHHASKVSQSAIRRALPHARKMFATAGGKARWKDTTPEQRSAAARHAARARWDARPAA